MEFLTGVILFILLGSMPALMGNASWQESSENIISFETHEEVHLSVVSGQDEREEKEALLLDKFRVLLGLRSHPHQTKEVFESPSPAPSPFEIESEAPSPSPIMQPIPLHPRRRHPPPHSTIDLPPHKIKGHDDIKILVALLVSVGATLAVLAVGFLFLAKKYYRRRKRCTTVYTGVDKEIKNDPSFDLFYLNTLATALEPGNSSNSTVNEEEDQTISSADEIVVSVDDGEESIRHQGDHISTRTESRSSGDESFHSLCESNASSNNARLSNVSASSFTDAIEGFSPKVSNVSPTQNPLMPKHSPPAPPPPPPPLPFYTIHSSSSVKLKANRSPPSSECPVSSSRSNETPIPQKTPSNIPPPPCPPLFMNKNSLNNGPPQFATLGKDGTPLPKLKPLHWDKVRATPDRSMVWDKLRSSSFEFDEEMIESLFGYNLKSAFQNDEGKSKTPSPSKHVLEPKRLQNMTILSKALNVTSEQVCDALVQGNGLKLQQLEALAKMEPTKEEEAKLSNYKGDINELGSAEKLVRAMLNIPFAFERIEAMLYRATFEDEIVHLRNAFSMLEEACKELRSSRLFLKLLEAVLKTGNRMNVGTIRGGANAFKLDTLLKLADVKGTDGKTTLLHFVVQEIIKSQGIRTADSIMGKINCTNKMRTAEEKEEGYKRIDLDLVSGLSTELCNVKKTASIDLDVLATSVSNLSNGMAKLRKLALEDLSKDAMSSNFVGAMKSFVCMAEQKLSDLQEDEAKVIRSVKEITEYFHGEVGKGESNLLHIFVIVRDFLAMLDQVCRELKSSKAPFH